MELQDPYRLYLCFVALKNHFTTEAYDFLKYNGKINASRESFYKRKDYKLFGSLASKLSQSNTIPFLVSQFISFNNVSISSILEQPLLAQRKYLEWKDRTLDLKKLYETDLKVIAEKSNYSCYDLISQNQYDYPLLFKLVSSSSISPETYSLLNDLFNQTSKKYNGLENDTLFLSLNLKYKKYRTFINLSLEDVLKMTPKDLSILK